MMICPIRNKCDLESVCDHAGKHEKNKDCDIYSAKCPGCSVIAHGRKKKPKHNDDQD